MFGSSLSTKSLANACRSLSTLLHSGVDVKRSFQLAAEKSIDPRARRALAAVALDISRGEDITGSMREQEGVFPNLLIDMIGVAEQSGSLPEILEGLADHYENNLRLRKMFLGAIAWPVIQLVAAILIVGLVIFILGFLPGSGVIEGMFFGLSGARGAIIWLGCTFGTLAALLLGYVGLKRSLAGRQLLDPLLIQLPVVGRCMRSFAIARFSWAYYLTQQTGMPMKQSLTGSLRATANGAFISRTRIIVERVQSGDDLSDALAAAQIFPPDFLQMVAVAETSGTVPETLQRLSPQFEDDARRCLTALTMTFAWLIWSAVAAFIIFLIVRFFMWYTGLIYDASRGNFDALDGL